MLPKPLEEFIARLSRVPSIGPRQATRIGFYLVRARGNGTEALAAALAALKDVAPCARCSFPFSAVESGDELLCTICANPRRQRNVIAIVEKETDMLSLENMKKFSGTYLVLGEFGREGVLDSQQRQRLSDFKNRIKNESGVAEEIILALSPTTIANIEAGLIIEELKGLTKRVTRLARGLPTGGEIEFADEDTLSAAFENRR